jgi:hypothetical protein
MWGQPPSAVCRAPRRLTTAAAKQNWRSHPLRWKRRFPHSLAVTEGVKIKLSESEIRLFRQPRNVRTRLCNPSNRAPPVPSVCQIGVNSL